MAILVFRCGTTGKNFPSNFRATIEELKSIPGGTKITLRCEACQQQHDFLLEECTIDDGV